ncbi:hypothetical protein CAPTEDRAFT_211922 [Capitella teleta]|uniref:Uncharacterized protein n=1 Tax=Capitella teleta TaxID=283909 RepID=R7UL13_CAPTE|nr:hypothetical protein CAPTEDRAFT_211922 [Capitella teleta]|eukprot:ELU04473.1 hypothetical protein CAPTEDRAFT_211922 [Capitella teleta]
MYLNGTGRERLQINVFISKHSSQSDAYLRPLRKSEIVVINCLQYSDGTLADGTSVFLYVEVYPASSSLALKQDKGAQGTDKDFPFGLLIAIAIGVIIGIILGFIFLMVVFTCKRSVSCERSLPCIGCTLSCRHRRQQTQQRETNALLVDGTTIYPGCDDGHHDAYKLVEVTCRGRPVPDLACDCAQAELIAQQTRLIDHKAKMPPGGESRVEGSPCTIYERPPMQQGPPSRRSSSDLLKDHPRDGADDWAPEDVYRSVPSVLKTETYPRLGRPLVTFKGEGPGCSAGTAATLQRIPDHPGICPGSGQAPRPQEGNPPVHCYGPHELRYFNSGS